MNDKTYERVGRAMMWCGAAIALVSAGWFLGELVHGPVRLRNGTMVPLVGKFRGALDVEDVAWDGESLRFRTSHGEWLITDTAIVAPRGLAVDGAAPPPAAAVPSPGPTATPPVQ